ncbi:hypothetical protein BDV12DRAFT_173548 [Aspergillus spectabilis]
MAVTTDFPSDDKLSALWHSACNDYAKETGITLADGEISNLRGPEDLSRQLESEKDNFEDFRMKKRPLLHAMQAVLAPFESWGDLVAGVAAAAFPPASSIMGAMLLLVRGARRVTDAFNMISDLFHKLGNFALRLEAYKGVPLSEGMKTIIVNVLVTFLRVCAASQKLVSQGSLRARFSKWAKNVFVEDTSIVSLLGELEELTSQEHLMVSACSLKITHQALRNTEELLERDDRRNDRERLQRVKAALGPVSASSQVFSSINENRIPGSGGWIEEKLRAWWEGPAPLLWLHGGPGVGKSHIASKIITGLSSGELSGAPAPVVASYFCRNNDVDLRSLNKGLRTLAWQVAAERPSFAVHVEEFCLKEDPANSYAIWKKLLMDYFTDSSSPSAACFVIDGLDEAEPEEQEVFFSLLEKAFTEEYDINTSPALRIVLLSRDSVGSLLEEHSLGWIPKIEVGIDQNKEDLHGYVSEKLQKAKLFRGTQEFRDEIVNEISREAEGLWEWANLVIKSVLRCRTKEQIRKVVRTMPRGIGAMLREELQRLSRELSTADEVSDGEDSAGEAGATQIDQLNAMLSFVAMAQKPLTVQQLDLMLEIIFKEEVLNLEDDLRTLYSSLFLIRTEKDKDDYRESDVVILRHSSFYEFFRTSEESGPIYVNVDRAEANFLYVTLYAIRQTYTPNEHRHIGEVRFYATKFLPSHLKRAKPEQAGHLRGTISNLFEDIFTIEPRSDWLISEIHFKDYATYFYYPDSRVSDLGLFWLNTENRGTANERAELVLNWLLPDAKQRFTDNARVSDMASGACPFTVLFSFRVIRWYQRWLQPADLRADDGLPTAAPLVLIVYNEMAAGRPEPETDGFTERLPTVHWGYLRASEILVAAETAKLQQTPMWHARVAQALLGHDCSREAVKRFQMSLDQHQKSPSLSPLSLAVIHRDISRAYTKTQKHKEALVHLELADSLRNSVKKDEDDYDDDDYSWNDRVAQLLNLAQMKRRAKLTEDALTTANKAWEVLLNRGDDESDPDLFSFFSIFLELHQTHRLRSVFDFGATHFKEITIEGMAANNFGDVIFDSLTFRSRVIYRALHHALSPNDQEYLDLVASLLVKVDTLDWERHNIADLKYILGTILFEKGRVSLGVQAWYQVATISNSSTSMNWDISTPQKWSRCHLVRLCLNNTDILFEHPPLLLDEEAESSDVCLVASTWLRDHGDVMNAREALRGRLKSCINLLSDDDPSNDEEAFMSLFKTFLAAGDCPDDLSAALYLLKQDHERHMNAHAPDMTEEPQDNKQEEVSNFVTQVRISDDGVRNEDGDNEDDIDSLDRLVQADTLTECASCRECISSIHYWYFCRSCPFSSLCPWCYRQFRSSDDPSTFPGICNPHHEFLHTGSFLKPSECVPEAKVPLVSSDGERRVIWVEEWKDSLAEKWQTADFAFEGGFSAWFMRVLPEPQKSRWATFFKT